MIAITDFSQTVISGASVRDIDIAAVIRWYYGYLLVICPLAVWLLLRCGRALRGTRLADGLAAAAAWWQGRPWRVPLLCGVLVLASFASLVIQHRQEPALLVVAFLLYGAAAALSLSRRRLPGTLIFCVASAVCALPFSTVIVRADFFEGANSGLMVDGFFSFGQLPVLQSFDAHMFSLAGWDFLYAWLTGDQIGAWYSLPAGFLMTLLLIAGVRFALGRFLGGSMADFLLLLTPIFYFVADFYFIGLLLVPVLLGWMHAHRMAEDGRGGAGRWGFADFAFALAFLASCLCRLDIGASWGLAMEAAAILFLMPRARRPQLASFLVVQLAVGALFLAAVYGLGTSAGVDWDAFLRDFRLVAGSNQHWAYGAWGPRALAVLFYGGVPILLGLLVMYFWPRLRTGWDTPQGMLLLFFAVTAICNVPRTLVRHSLQESNPMTLGLPLLLLIGLLAWMDRRRVQPWLEAVVIACLLFLPGAGVFRAQSALPCGILPSAVVGAAQTGTPSERLQPHLTPQQTEAMAGLRAFFDQELSPGETYLDFTNQSLLYAHLGRRNIAFVNQVPAMLSGRAGQQAYIDAAERADVPYALVPCDRGDETARAGYPSFTAIDGIQNTDRFYLLAEYIGTHYEPYARIGDFALWRRKGRAPRGPLPAGAEPLTLYGYDVDSVHHHDLWQVPRIWAEHGGLSETGTQTLALDAENVADLAAAGTGGLLLEIDAPAAQTCGLAVETLDPRTQGKTANDTFQLAQGTHRYYLRLSSDLLWYAGANHRLHLQLPEGVTVRGITWLPDK